MRPRALHPGPRCSCLSCKRQRETDSTGIAGGFATLAAHEAREQERANARRRKGVRS